MSIVTRSSLLDPGTVLVGWSLQLALATLVTFFALVFSCMIAFQEAKHSRLFAAAIAVQMIEKAPELLLAFGIEIPIWSSVAATIIAFILLIPMLVSWAGMEAAKGIYVAVLAFIFVSIFAVLVSVSA